MSNVHGSKWIRPERRQRIYERDGFQCVWCGSPQHLTLDHARVRANGGTNATSNLLTACQPCNSRRGTLPIAVFARLVSVRTGEPAIEIERRVAMLRRRAV